MVDKKDGRSKERRAGKEKQRRSTESAGKSLAKIAEQIKKEGIKEEAARAQSQDNKLQTELLSQIATSIAGMPKENEEQKKRSQSLQATFDRALQVIQAEESTDQELSLARETIATLQSGFDQISEATAENAIAAAQAQFDSARQIIDGVQASQQAQETDLSNEKALEKLDAIIANSGDAKFGTSTEDLQALREQFQGAQETLENPEASQEELALAQEIIDSIRDTAQTEEERREAAKARAKEQSIFGRMAKGIEAQKKAYDDFVGSAAGGGLIAALGAAAILFTDPETLLEGIKTAIEAVIATVETISAFLSGDFSEGMDLLEANFGDISGVLGVAVLFLFRKVIFGAIITGIKSLAVTLGTTLLTTITTAFAGMSAAAIAVTVGAIVALVANIVNGFIEGFSAFSDEYEKSGSITSALYEGLTTFAANIIAAPFDFIKWLIGWAAGALGFDGVEESLASFSFVDMLKNGIDDVVDFLINLGSMIFNFDYGRFFSDVLKATGDFFKGIGNSISGFFRDIGITIGGAVFEFVQNIKNFDYMAFLSELPERIIGLILAPIDMIKDVFASILSFFGLDAAAEQLESFSVTELVTKLFDKITGMVTGMFSFIGDAFSNFEFPSIGGVIDKINDTIKALLRSVLPDPDAPLLSIGGLAAKAIPDAIYQYAYDISPQGFEEIMQPVKPFDMSEMQRENTDTRAETEAAKAAGGNSTAVLTTVGGDTNSTAIYSGEQPKAARSKRYNGPNQ